LLLRATDFFSEARQRTRDPAPRPIRRFHAERSRSPQKQVAQSYGKLAGGDNVFNESREQLRKHRRSFLHTVRDDWCLMAERYVCDRVGEIRSALRSLDDAPRQGSEGAPDAWLEIAPRYAAALHGIAKGDELIVVTWLHRAKRDVLQVHPRDDPSNPLTGIFATRSQDRPNPLGLHRVTVRGLSGTRLRIGPIEAIDGTPVIDVKAVLADRPEA
jgi:tRNA-Thr(GGU) m(6)t(6)A37 methyltransferase TsaA